MEKTVSTYKVLGEGKFEKQGMPFVLLHMQSASDVQVDFVQIVIGK